MFRGNRKYIFILVLCFTVLIVVQSNIPKPIDWRATYSENDRIPYGAYALREMIDDVFPGKKVTTIKKPVYNTLTENSGSKVNYFFINYSFSPDELDTRVLLDHVSGGGNVFAAASAFYGHLADTLQLATNSYYEYDDTTVVAGANAILQGGNDTLRINFTSPHLRPKKDYVYAKGVSNVIFYSFDTLHTTVLGTNKKNDANFIRVRFGRGNFYLSTLPEVFTNYNFVSETNSDYVYKALSYLPVEDTYWDEYYKYYGHAQETPLRVWLSEPALSAAWFLLLVSLLLFIAFGAKRRQRIIPVVEPLKNTTLEFVNIVGTLYYQKGDHKNIASKMITYFLEHIRSRFFVKTSLFDEAFIKKVTALSGIPEAELMELFNFITIIGGSSIVREEEVLRLNAMIEKFHKNSKR